MRGVVKKCGLFVALFAVSATVLFTGSSASAASEYDDTFIFYNSSEDYYLNRINDPSQQYYFEKPLWEEIKDATNADSLSDAFADLLEARFNQDDGNNVTVMFNQSNTTMRIEIYNLEDSFFFETVGGTRQLGSISSTRQTLQLQYSPWQGRDLLISRIGGNTVATTIGSNSIIGSNPLDCNTFCMRPYYMNLNIPIYPDGYDGPLLDGETAVSRVMKPNITWSVNDKNAIVYSDSAKNTAVLDDYQIYWFISNTTTDIVQPTEPFALSGCTPPDYNNNFTVPIHFDYGVQAYYADQDCNILQVDDDGNILAENTVRLTIDGSTFDGSTTDHEAIIGEIEENAILKAIRQFRPNDGGLAGLIYAPIEAVATLPTIVGSCSPINLPLLGENISLECIRPTIQASPMGPVYNTISVIIIGIVTWWVAWRTFSTIKNIQDPQDDRVEVLKL